VKKLSIVIPAFNEEAAIASIIERTLSATEVMKQDGAVADVEIIVVDDGSEDRTTEIAQEFSNTNSIRLISYKPNRGYGAAIMSGFQAATGDLVAFLDADGTCDPLLFSEFLKKMTQTGADIVIGGRMSPGSEMPFVRKMGNIFYRTLLNALSGKEPVSDTASGMRLLKKSVLSKLYPLPTGMNFTPAMSVRAVLDRGIQIVEIPIPYRERIGRSKLSVMRDGFRFLITILEIAVTYKPLRFFGGIGVLFVLLAIAYGIPPLIHYLRYQNVPEDRIYRLVFVMASGISGIQFCSVGLIAQSMTNLIHNSEMSSAIDRILGVNLLKWFSFTGILCLIFALVLNRTAIIQYLSLGMIYEHWSVVVTGAFFVLLGFQFLAFSVVNRILVILRNQKQFSDRDDSKEMNNVA